MESDPDSSATVLPAPRPQILTAALIALIVGAPTIQYRLELGSFSMALMEPIGLACAGLLWWQVRRSPGGWKARIAAAMSDPLTRFVLGMAAALLVWSAAVGLWAGVMDGTPDGGWRVWLSDVRNWAVPILIFGALLLGVHDRWRRWTLLFVPVGLAQALLGLYQAATNSFRPFAGQNAFYKADFILPSGSSRPSLASFGVGLFAHPNQLALYLVLAVLIGLAWGLIGRRRLFKVAVVAILLAGLALTYAKTSIVVAVLGGSVILAHQRIRSNRAFLSAGGAALLAGGGAIWLATALLPRLWLATLGWRVRLWESALGLLAGSPGVLAVGGAMDDFARVAIYPQPHNLLFHLVLAYGLFGLLWLGLLVWRLHSAAWRMRRAGDLHREPLLAALWLGLWAFLVIGALESPLISIEWRMILLLVVACFVGLRREILREPYAAV
jgi:hypothetical protein